MLTCIVTGEVFSLLTNYEVLLMPMSQFLDKLGSLSGYEHILAVLMILCICDICLLVVDFGAKQTPHSISDLVEAQRCNVVDKSLPCFL